MENKIQSIYALSPLQEGMLYHKLLNEHSAEYLVRYVIKVTGDLDIVKVKESLSLLSEKYEVLRTAIVLPKKGDKPLQVVLRKREIELNFIDLTTYTIKQQTEQIEKIKQEDLNRGFDLQKDSLVRVTIMKVSPNEHLVLWSLHHIILDGWCSSTVLTNFFRNYERLCMGEAYASIQATDQAEKSNIASFEDYIKWLGKQDKRTGLEYWGTLLNDYSETAIITPFNKSHNTGGEMARYSLTADHSLKEQLKIFSQQNNVTINTVLESALGILLQKHNMNHDVVFGKVVSGRNADIVGIDQAVGLFINTIPVRVKTEKNSNFKDLIQYMQNQALDSSCYDFCSLADIQEQSNHGRDLIKVLFVFENYFVDELAVTEEKQSVGNTLMIEFEEGREQTNYPLNFSVSLKDTLDLDIIYNPKLYAEHDICLILEQYHFVLKEIIQNSTQRIGDINIVSPIEKEKILGEFNNTAPSNSLDMNIVTHFENQVAQTPDKVALCAEGKEITYQELNAKANELAVRLRQMGIGRDDYVAIMAERNIETIIGICGIVKAGGAYVPVDPAYPLERVAYMLEDCKPKAILVNGLSYAYKEDIPIIDVSEAMQWTGRQENPVNINTVNDLIYLIYTSGTTGKPKGVMVEHKSVTRLVHRPNYVELDKDTIILQTGSLSFDAATFEIWGALLNGGELQIGSHDVIMDAAALKQTIAKHKINTMFLTTALFNQLINSDVTVFDGIGTLLFGGEKTSELHVKKLLENNAHIQLTNVYGPTETTTFATYYSIDIDQVRAKTPIGKPISNTATYIMNEGRLCGIGMVGELCIAGDGVARGYLNKPELTEAKFIPNPYGPGMMYCSGDLARWLPDGNIEYLGRIDDQVKLRGFRIELGEIESTIRQINAIKDVALLISEHEEEKSIYAYLVAEKEIDIKLVREKLVNQLPAYMIPSYMMQIDYIPVTRNGKLNKAALPKIEVNEESIYVAPRNQAEEKVIEIFQRVLEVNKIGIRDNFFRMGGHSLKATWVINQIEEQTGVRLPLSEMFNDPTAEGLAQKLINFESNYTQIPRVKLQEKYPASSVQKRIFAICNDKDTISYNVSWGMETNDRVDFGKVNYVLNKLIQQHEILRTYFLVEDGEVYQKIAAEIEAKVEYDEIEHANEEDKKRLLMEFIRPFDLETAPLFRIKVIKVHQGADLLFFDMHHIISDGLSTNIIIEDFKALYAGKALTPLRVQYKDYSEWMRSRDLTDQREYWHNEFKDVPSSLELSLDYPRPQFQSFRGHTIECTIKPEIKESIIKLCKQTGTTEYMVLLSAFMVLLREYSHQEDIVVGSPFSGRVHPDTEKILGMFVNTLVMRGKPQGDKSFHSFLEEMKEKCLQAQANQEYALEELIENLDLVRDSSRNPLYDIVFSFQNIDEVFLEGQGLRFKDIGIERNISKFDITMTVEALQKGYGLSFEYRSDLFSENSINQMMAHYVQVLKEITQNPTRKIIDINVISPTEKEKILGEFNNTAPSNSLDMNIVTCFEDQVAQIPNKVAVCADGKEITYQELNAKANELAVRLRQMGIGRDDYVAIMAERNIETIIGICGIVKAGGAYVPVDPAYPLERVAYMLEDCKPKAILVNGSSYAYKGDIPVVDISEAMQWTGRQENPVNINTVNDLIYLIYTSGTTGKPKGVMIEHKGVMRLVHRPNYVELNKDTVILQTGSLSFDAATFEIWGALLNGGELHISSQDLIMDASALKRAIESQRITTMWLTVTLFNQLVNEDVTVFDQLETLIFGGEKVSEVHIRKFKKENKKTQLINGYGPTETTTFATYYPIDADQLKVKTPIGKPITNTTTYIMNEGRLCGIGMAGELCIAGDGVARGYLNNPELTKAKFIPNPYGSGMMYRSGDLVKWLQDGNIEYLGRIDDQVKVRGFRIELGEIESVIRQIKDIRDTALIISEKEQEKSICAYLVGGKVLDIKAIRQELSEHLPAYMIPSHMMQIECIPVTRNGKLNKKALPKIEVNSEETYVAPRNQTEEEIVLIFSEILGIDNLGVTDSFYDMGGDSIKAIRVVSKLREANYSVSMREIIQFQTVENVAKVIRRVEEKEESRQEEISGEVPLTPIQDTFFKWKLNNPHHFNQSVLLANPEGFNEEGVKQSLLAIVKHHDILRAIFKDGKQEILSIKQCEKPELRIYDFSELKDEKLSKAVEVKNDELQKSINLATGPLVKCALFKTTNGDHLMIAIHHLVVDGVSWRIILEDFESSYKQYVKTKEIELPKKTTSYQEWSNELLKYGSISELQKEVSYWNGVLKNANFGEIDADMDGADIGSGRISFEIDARKTSKLVRLGRVYNAEFQEILLASLAHANELWQGHKKLTLFLEGHGREEFSNNLRIDRTVGWFTTIYPITIEALDTLENSIVKTKEILKTVPNCGIGYGIIQHQQVEKIPNINIDISFNFLGELSRGKSRFIKSSFPTGNQIAEENIISNLIINSIIDEGKLKLDIFYNKGKYSEYLIQQLKNCYEKTLLEAIEHTNNLAVNGKVEHENFESSFKQSKVIEEGKRLQITTDNIFALKQYDISSFEKTLFSKELLEYEKNIVDRKAECFEPFAYQKFFFNNYPDNVCGAKTEIQGDITQERLISIVKDIVCEQSIFRLSYDKDRNQLQQYSYTSDWHIPFIDISSNNHLEQDLEWCNAVIQASQLFKEQRLLSKIFIVKIGPNRYYLYFFVHHGLWDLASTEILGQIIKDKISRKQGNLVSNYYTEYTKIRNKIENKNQLQPDAKDFVDNFFKQASIYDSLMKGKTAQRCLHIKYKYNESVLNQILKDPILWVTELYDLLNIQPYIQSKSSFPFLLMHFGREDMGFQTLGLHLDIIPYQYNGVTHSIKRLGKQQVHNNYGHLLFESKGDDSERRNKYFKHIPVVNFYADMEIDNIFDPFNHYEMELKDMVAGNEITLRIFKDILYVAMPTINNDMDSAFKIASEYLGLK